ncbi:MAG: ABC transporter ATP-binding protein [Deltaproteobacteria bacterium]|nr:ABC transporter ATP-binding protein [Deltaproteobacteria bacterium]
MSARATKKKKTTTSGPGRSEVFQLQVRGLRKSFGEQPVLRGIDLDVERGRINVVIGGSGAGKSVLMKHLIGLIKPNEGHIWVDGEDIVPMDDFVLNTVREKFGMLFQYAALFDSMTVEENVMFPLVEHKRREMSRASMRELVREKLHALGLFSIEEKYPSELSGGMRKRVGLARAIVMEPEILFYDEPTTGLDPIATKNVDDMIQEISEKFEVTSVVISHDMASTFRIGHRVSMLYKGEIIATGTPQEILKDPPDHLREFLQTSGAVSVGSPSSRSLASAERSEDL